MKTQPYIGMTGFKTVEEIHQTTQQLEQLGYPNKYTAMFGLLTSETRLKWPDRSGKRSPAVEDLAQLVDACPKWSIPMLHYFQRDNVGFAKRVMDLFETTGAHAAQLNIAWPDVAEVEQIQSAYVDFVFTLQVPQRAIEGMSEQTLITKLSEYAPYANYVLIDLSGGKGVEFSLTESKSLLAAAKKALPDTHLAIAGGLHGGNVYEKISALGYEQLTIDAESGIMSNNTLDEKKVYSYLNNSRFLFR